MIKVTITNDILNSIIEIELNRYKISLVELSQNVLNKLRKNSKKIISYFLFWLQIMFSFITFNDFFCLFFRQRISFNLVLSIRNYFLALNYLEEKLNNKEKLSKKLLWNDDCQVKITHFFDFRFRFRFILFF